LNNYDVDLSLINITRTTIVSSQLLDIFNLVFLLNTRQNLTLQKEKLKELYNIKMG
jgi:hypothetical protein